MQGDRQSEALTRLHTVCRRWWSSTLCSPLVQPPRIRAGVVNAVQSIWLLRQEWRVDLRDSMSWVNRVPLFCRPQHQRFSDEGDLSSSVVRWESRGRLSGDRHSNTSIMRAEELGNADLSAHTRLTRNRPGQKRRSLLSSALVLEKMLISSSTHQ